ncbi:MAG TPA: hypothetical protein VMZ92_08110 [Planctomycetota bacterium]|nr:hypothetical protein [Planctomycetota bacterium]
MFTEAVLTVAESKRLIAKGVASHPEVLHALTEGTLVICKGTTNAYVVEEVLGKEIRRTDYVTGSVVPATRQGQAPTSAKLPDVILEKGRLVEGTNSKEIVPKLKPGDVFIKGANAINYERNQAALLIGHPTGGTIGAAIGVLVARRVRLLVPVGLEKNIPGDLNDVAVCMNEGDETDESDPRHVPTLWPIPGEIFTEIEAIELLCGCEVVQTAAGGIAGAEGAVRLLIRGSADQVRQARALIANVQGEPPFISE